MLDAGDRTIKSCREVQHAMGQVVLLPEASHPFTAPLGEDSWATSHCIHVPSPYHAEDEAPSRDCGEETRLVMRANRTSWFFFFLLHSFYSFLSSFLHSSLPSKYVHPARIPHLPPSTLARFGESID